MLLVFLTSVFAHQPRLTDSLSIEVSNPEISQAFYAELNGTSRDYHINSETEFLLYVGVLVPVLPGIDKDVSADVYLEQDGAEVLLFSLDGETSSWEVFNERFVGDSYYSGPEKEMQVGPGKYHIEVYSKDNLGKYVLVVGKEELFSPKDTLDVLIGLPFLKLTFFEKPPWAVFEGILGNVLLGILIVVLLVLAALFWLITKR